LNMPSIPQRTRMDLACPATPGNRHNQMIRVAVSLIANGLSSQTVFAELRGKYDHSVLDAEIRGVIKWACGKNLRPSWYDPRFYNPATQTSAPVTVASATANAERFLKGFRCGHGDLWHASPWRPLEDAAFDALPLLAGLFNRGELVNMCSEYGQGVTKTRDEWMVYVREHGAPAGSIGCMFRPNPVSSTPTGENGGWTDADVTAHRFALVESDVLSLDLQLPLLARLPLPIATIIFSGGKSYHALVRVDAADWATYRRKVSKLLSLLRPLGFDQATGNPSRMSRLPGALRCGSMQRLVFLNPDVSGNTPIFGGVA
jgi:hypothetical protein